MPLSPEHKQRSREKILASAYKLFSRNGYDAVSIDQVMAEAGLTRGAFYAHFKNKNALYRQSIIAAVNESVLLEEKPEDISEVEWLKLLLHRYMSRGHVERAKTPCPLACLASDAAIRNSEVRETYTDLYHGMNQAIEQRTHSLSEFGRQQVLALSAMMIGSVAVARAVSDDGVADEVLEACRTMAEQMLNQHS